jgi:hypothetical protein
MRHAAEISRQRTASADRAPEGPRYLGTRNASLRKNMIAFSKLPSTAVFWHIKQWRTNATVCKLEAVGKDPDLKQLTELASEGPEDWVAECVYIPPGSGSSGADGKVGGDSIRVHTGEVSLSPHAGGVGKDVFS